MPTGQRFYTTPSVLQLFAAPFHRILLYCSLIFLVCCPYSSFAKQEGIENARFQVRADKVIVHYDLLGEGIYTVTLHVSDDVGATFSPPLQSVAGDVGPEIQPGRGKKIVWSAVKDIKGLTGNGFVFEVRAIRPKRRKVWPWLLGVGVAGAATRVGIEVMREKDNTAEIVIDMPDPEK